nr:hypothetical protein [Deltaproteobacteria bacterium]
MDLEALYRKLEFASFSQREQIAGEVVRDVPRDELGPVVRGLEHPHRGVRLGIIEILRRAEYREALRKLLAHAQTHTGDDRVFAVRALSQLAQPGDDFLVDPTKKWLASGEPFLEPHANKLADVLRMRAPAEPVKTDGTESLDRLVIALFTAVKGAERIALVEQIERRGPQALAAAAKIVLAKGNEHLVAYLARAVIRSAAVLPAPAQLVSLFEAARKRLGVAPIAHAAIDDALLALGGRTLSPTLLSRLAEMDKSQVEAVVVQLVDGEPSEVALHVPALLDALARNPVLWSALGPALVYAAPHVRESTRAELRRVTELVVDDLRHGKPLPPITIVSATYVLAKIGQAGEPLPKQLRVALDRLHVAEAATGLAALCSRLATEDAATALLAMLKDPLPEARAAAREAVQTWQSTWVSITSDKLEPHYKDDKGELLARRGDKLVVALSGEEYVLDGRGRPVRQGDTEYGGCACCSPPRALVKRRGDGLRCPTTWESHLRDNGRTMFEKDHALGRCKRCDSARPRVRDGDKVICLDCGAGIASEGVPMIPMPGPTVPSEHGRGGNEDALPRPPSKDELEHISPHI